MTEELAIGAAVNRVIASIWLAWLILATVVTARFFRWEVDYFSSPGAIFRTLENHKGTSPPRKAKTT